MPLEIDELVISIEVSNAAAGGAAAAEPMDDRQQLIEECVERVLEILRERREP